MGVMQFGEREGDLRRRHDDTDEDGARLTTRDCEKNVERLRDVVHRDVDENVTGTCQGERCAIGRATHGRQDSANGHDRHCQPRSR